MRFTREVGLARGLRRVERVYQVLASWKPSRMACSTRDVRSSSGFASLIFFTMSGRYSPTSCGAWQVPLEWH